MAERSILWWGRHGLDYSRNLVLRELLQQLGYRILDFQPRWPFAADLEAFLCKLPQPDLVWVPCFRQRDLPAASRWARRRGVPLVFDPLISAYDKQVFERGKHAAGSHGAERLRRRELRLLQRADLVLADTAAHARFFATTFDLPPQRLAVIPVGAEEALFRPLPMPVREPGAPLQVLFYGSFIGLQGPQLIIEAARLYQGPPVLWRMIGEGPLLEECRRRAAGLDSVRFEPWQPYESLPGIIADADLLLGIFGASDKAARVIPNKVYQALACGRPLVTRYSPAYPAVLLEQASGITWVEPGSAAALAQAVATHAAAAGDLKQLGAMARRSYERHFSMESIRVELDKALVQLLGMSAKDRGYDDRST